MSLPTKYLHVRNIDRNKTHFVAFKILDNPGNGDCLFSSIMQFLEYNENYEVPGSVTDLRQKIVNYIAHSSNWNRFVDTIIFNLEKLLPILEKEDFSDAFKSKIYSKYMGQQYQYGTFAELQAASEIFNFVYVVFRKEEHMSNTDTYETRYNCYSSDDHHKLKSRMFLFFSGKPSSGHFQCMKPILPKYIFLIPQGTYKLTDECDAPDNSYRILTLKKITDDTLTTYDNQFRGKILSKM